MSSATPPSRFLDDDAISRLADALLASHPEQEGVIRAFLPLMLARNRLLREGEAGNEPAPTRVLRTMLVAMSEGFPMLRQQAQALLDLDDASAARLLDDESPVSQEGEALQFALTQTRRTLAALAAAQLPDANIATEGAFASEAEARQKSALTDTRRTCPYCDSAPELSVVHDTEGHRSLVCGGCGRHWRFRRLSCPACGLEKAGNLHHIYVEARPEERGVFCAACGHYVLEVDIRHLHLQPEQCQVLTLGLGALDVLMQQEGKRPLTSLGE